MDRVTRYLDTPTKIETRERDGKRYIEGLIPYNSRSEDLGGFTEIIAPSAFRKTVADAAEVYAFWAHNSSEILGSTRNGTMTLDDRADGLAFSIEVRDTAISEDRWAAIQRGDVVGTSFGFYPVRDEWDHETEPATRTLTEVRLIEISPGVAFPAYPGAQSGAAMRSVVLEARSKTDKHITATEPAAPTPEPALAPPDTAPEDRARAEDIDAARKAAIAELALCGIQI